MMTSSSGSQQGSSVGFRGAPLLVLGLLLVVSLGVLFLLWQAVNSLRDAQAELAAENLELRDKLEDAQARLVQAEAGPVTVPVRADSRDAAPASSAREVPRREPPLPANILELGDVEVESQADRLVTTLHFNPTTAEPLGVFALVVRLPKGSESRIVGLEPAGAAPFTNVSFRIAENGLFAVYHADPTGVMPLAFNLAVSGPASATVRGTCGLEPFEVDIRPDGAAVNPL